METSCYVSVIKKWLNHIAHQMKGLLYDIDAGRCEV